MDGNELADLDDFLKKVAEDLYDYDYEVSEEFLQDSDPGDENDVKNPEASS